MKPRLQRRLLLLLLLCTVSASFLLFPISLKPPPRLPLAPPLPVELANDALPPSAQRSCATVEEMGAGFAGNIPEVNLRVRDLVETHFRINGAVRVRELPPHQFCSQGFVLGKASEAGFGNEMYKILTAAALSIMLNRSLIIGKSRGKYPFEDYILYSNTTLTMEEVKHLWRKNKCIEKYKKELVIRVDDFEKPMETNVICGNWRAWRQPIIWFQGTTDAVASQFFLKNIHTEMRNAALSLFGPPESLQARANVFGELLRMIISPSHAIKEAVNWALNGGVDPDLALHMRMMSNRSLRAKQAALNCIKIALSKRLYQNTTAKIVLVSDTPSFVKDIIPDLTKFANVVQFNYKSFMGVAQGENISRHDKSDFRVKDWGPAPRWVAFADFFLAARAKHAVISGAHRRVGTTYAQLIAALAAANQLGEDSSATWKFSFYSSFQSNLLAGGLANQVGWGHVWNRYAGPFSCRGQKHQCAYTPLLPPAWWDGDWQSPISRDVRRLQEYGVQLNDTGKVIESRIQSFCKSKKQTVRTIPVIRRCNSRNCT